MSGAGSFVNKKPSGGGKNTGYFPKKAKPSPKGDGNSEKPAYKPAAKPAAKPVTASAPSHSDAPKKRKAEGEHESKPFKKFKPKAPEVPKVFTKDERRQIKKERRARKPHGEALEAANELWKVSLSKISSDQQTTEISSVLANIKDKLVEVSQAHDASRVVENCVKYGTVEQREQIHQALTTHYLELCQNHYSYHVIEKLLKYGTEQMRDTVFAELSGHFKHLSQHRDAHHVLEFLYSNASMMTATQRHAALSEFLGPQFKIYTKADGSPHSLQSIFESENESKQDIAMTNVRSYLDKMISKELTRSGIFHTLLLHYMQHARLSNIQEMLAQCINFLENLWVTEDGARVVMFCVAFGANKDRKAVLKAFKDKVKSLALTAPGAHLLQFCLDVIDDTVALRKQVCTELVADPATLTELLGSRTCGLRVLLHLLAPHSQRHFAQHELDFITPPTLQHADERASVVISKKDPAVRHKELLSDRILPSILAACTENDEVLSTMLRDAHQCSVVVEALREAADSDAGLAALERVAAMVAADPESENVSHLLTHPVAHRCLRRLIFIEQPEAENRRAERHKGKDQPAMAPIVTPATPARFAVMLHQHLSGRYSQFAQTCGAFVIVAIMENSTSDILKSIVKELSPLLATLLEDKRAGASLLAQYIKANSPASASSAAAAATPGKKAVKGRK